MIPLSLWRPRQAGHDLGTDEPRQHHVVLRADGARILINPVGKSDQVIADGLEPHHLIDEP